MQFAFEFASIVLGQCAEPISQTAAISVDLPPTKHKMQHYVNAEVKMHSNSFFR